jgi:hypothetical protein
MAKRSYVEMVQLTAAVPRGHAGFWSIILGLDAVGPWRLCDVDQRTNVDRASSKDYVHRLERGGFVHRIGEGPGHKGKGTATLWRLLKSPFEAPRLDRAGNELQEPLEALMWRTARIVKTFTASELASMASLPDREVRLGLARRFVSVLAAAEILRPVGPASGPVERTYRLVRDLGPLAPSISRTQMVFDPNSRQVIGTPVLDEVSL